MSSKAEKPPPPPTIKDEEGEEKIAVTAASTTTADSVEISADDATETISASTLPAESDNGVMLAFLAELQGSEMDEIRSMLQELRQKQEVAAKGLLAQQNAYEQGPERSMESLMPTFNKLKPYRAKCQKLAKQVSAIQRRVVDLKKRANNMQNVLLPYEITPKPKTDSKSS